jgi:hypothetical protein
MPPRKPKVIEQVELLIPKPKEQKAWVVLGLDLSMSRTGYAIYYVGEGDPKILGIGSLKPKDTHLPNWTRCSLTAHALRDILALHVSPYLGEDVGFLISAEAATPRNDYLSSIHGIVNAILLNADIGAWHGAMETLYINPSTLRKTVGLIERGANNKGENIKKAYEFIDREKWPNLDTDSCDAVIMGAMGIFAAHILMGRDEEVPLRYKTLLCDTTIEIKGSKKKPRLETKGLFHCPRYWVPYSSKEEIVVWNNAATAIPPKKKVAPSSKITISI